MVMEFFNDISLARSPLSNWDDFFLYMAEHSKDRVILIFDEFPFIVDKYALDYKSPIYGRRTGQWMVD